MKKHIRNSKSEVHRAYARISEDFSEREQMLEKAFDKLLEAVKAVESPFMRKLKPVIAVSLKWKFDYLFKTLESPFELEQDVAYWLRVIQMMKVLGEQGWYELQQVEDRPHDPWGRTAKGFDLGWTTTTEGKEFDVSRRIAEERMAQIIEMLGGADFFKDKEILDSGCGPGRYIDIMRGLGPQRIEGMDQGKRLIQVLTKRFKGDAKVRISRGTCEKLVYPSESFDIVFSNGVMHHTPGDIPTMLKDHARVLKKGGVMFIMLVGKGGLELKIWEFVRNFLYDVPLAEMLDAFGRVISPLRMQGIVDHMYGEYQQTSRKDFERLCAPLFSRIQRVPGVLGLDVTPDMYQDDPYFLPRMGTGQLRYLCFK